jgi:hypothetical protein
MQQDKNFQQDMHGKKLCWDAASSRTQHFAQRSSYLLGKRGALKMLLDRNEQGGKIRNQQCDSSHYSARKFLLGRQIVYSALFRQDSSARASKSRWSHVYLLYRTTQPDRCCSLSFYSNQFRQRMYLGGTQMNACLVCQVGNNNRLDRLLVAEPHLCQPDKPHQEGTPCILLSWLNLENV